MESREDLNADDLGSDSAPTLHFKPSDELKFQVSERCLPRRGLWFSVSWLFVFLIGSTLVNELNVPFIYILFATVIACVLVIYITTLFAPTLTWSSVHLTRTGQSSYSHYRPRSLFASVLTKLYYMPEDLEADQKLRPWIIKDLKKLRGIISRFMGDLSPDLKHLLKESTQDREYPDYFEIDDLISITISGDRDYSSNIAWDYPRVVDLVFELKFTFSDGSFCSGRCVISGLNSREQVTQLGAQLSSVAGIEWGEILENTIYTYSVIFYHGLTPDTSDLRAKMINVSSLSIRDLNAESLNTDEDVGDHQFTIREKQADEDVDDHQFTIREKRVDKDVGDHQFMIREKRVGDEANDLQPDDHQPVMNQLITDPWDPERDLFDGDVIAHTSSELIYEQLEDRNVYYLLAWFICVYIGLYFFCLIHSQQEFGRLSAVYFLHPRMLSYYISSLPSQTSNLLLLGVLIFTVILSIFHLRTMRLRRLHKVVCRTEINWDELTCTHYKGDQVFIFNMAEATQIHVQVTEVLKGTGKNTYLRYFGEISLRGRAESGDEISSTFLAYTGEHRSNKRVYQSSMRFAAIFAERLNVPLRYKESSNYLR